MRTLSFLFDSPPSFGEIFCADAGDFFSENAPLENIQALLLLFSLFLFLLTFFCRKRDDLVIVAFLAVISYAGFLREVDFDKMNLHPVLTSLLYGAGRYIIVSSGVVISLGWAILHFRHSKKAALNFFKSAEGIFIAIAALLILVSQIAEHSALTNNNAWEEISELCAYIFIFASSVVVLFMANPSAVQFADN